MEQKIKFILIGVAGFAVIFLFLFMQTASSRKQIMRQRDDLIKENSSLGNKIEKMQSAFRDYESRISSLGKELDKSSREKEELQGRLDQASKAKDELTERIKSLQSQLAQAAKQGPAAPQQQSTGDAYWGSVLKAKTDLELQLANIRAELKKIQINNEQLQREKSTLDLDAKNLKVENDDLKRQVDYNQKVMDSIAQELARERNDKNKIQEAFRTIKSENSLLVRQLTSLNSRKVNLERKLQQVQEEKNGLERRFGELETMLSDKLVQIDGIRKQVNISAGQSQQNTAVSQENAGGDSAVELSPIVVRPQGETRGAGPAGSLTARVLKVDRDNNFVIIDQGEETGVRIGNTFYVYRDGEKIARLEVIKTSKTVSACDIKDETASVRVGDKIK